jgi:hypothetical protein
VLAYFDHHASNGPTEAINGRLEALRRNALGFRNLTHYRIRSLLHCGNLARQIDALWFRKSHFISQHTDDFWEFAAHIRDLLWDEVREATGLDMIEIDELALRIRRAERIVVCWGMGLTQHKKLGGDNPRDR